MDILSAIFEARISDMANITQEDIDYISANSDASGAYNKIEELLDSLCPNNAYEILHAIDDFVSELNFENAYYNEKYYKYGFGDGVHLMRDIISRFSL